MKYSLGISHFLEEISSLFHSIVFLYFFALITEVGFISPCYSSDLFFSQLFVRPPQTAILLCQTACLTSRLLFILQNLAHVFLGQLRQTLAVIFWQSSFPFPLPLVQPVSHYFMTVLFRVCGLLICSAVEGSNFVLSSWHFLPSSVPGLPIPDHHIPCRQRHLILVTTDMPSV